jgi:hypothetical protein
MVDTEMPSSSITKAIAMDHWTKATPTTASCTTTHHHPHRQQQQQKNEMNHLETPGGQGIGRATTAVTINNNKSLHCMQQEVQCAMLKHGVRTLKPTSAMTSSTIIDCYSLSFNDTQCVVSWCLCLLSSTPSLSWLVHHCCCCFDDSFCLLSVFQVQTRQW